MGALYGFAYSEAALASLAAIPSKKVRRQVVNKIKTLSSNPYAAGCAKVQGVREGETLVYRIRSGDYRILYTVRNDAEIVVLDLGHRKDVYRKQVRNRP